MRHTRVGLQNHSQKQLIEVPNVYFYLRGFRQSEGLSIDDLTYNTIMVRAVTRKTALIFYAVVQMPRRDSFANIARMTRKLPFVAQPVQSGHVTPAFPTWIEARDTSAVGRPEARIEAIPEPNGSDLLTIGEVAERLRLSPRTVQRLIASDTLCAVKIGRSVRVQRSAVEALFIHKKQC